jgi:hypothetical protein
MELREIFNFVELHLLTQNAKSEDNIGMCLYRNAAGLSCSIGCLIPEDKYDPILENQNLMDGKDLPKVIEGIISDFNIDTYSSTTLKLDLLYDLQEVHDSHEPEAWPYVLEQVKNKYF